MKIIRVILIVFAIVAALISARIYLLGGWEVLMFGIPILGVLITHCVLHVKCGVRTSRWTSSVITAFLFSDLILISVTLAQWGVGDDTTFIRITHMFMNVIYSPHWYGSVLSLLTFVLVFLSWVCLWLVTHPYRIWYPIVTTLTNIVSFLSICGLLFIFVLEANEMNRIKINKETALMEAFGGLPPTDCTTGSIPIMPDDNYLNLSHINPNHISPPVGVAPVWWNAGPTSIEEDRVVIHVRYGNQANKLRYEEEEITLQSEIEVLTSWYVEGVEGIPVEIRVTSEDSKVPMPLVIKYRNGQVRNDGLLDYTNSRIIQGRHRAFSGLFYVPGPGCYIMEAKWLGGSWRIPFALGW